MLEEWKNRIRKQPTGMWLARKLHGFWSPFIAWWLHPKTERMGWSGTAILILLAALTLFLLYPDEGLDPNEVGDFLAGFFAAMAFLWLILGYRQQADALTHQAKELEASVAEQRQMVIETRKLIEIEQQRRLGEALAHFSARCRNSTGLEQGRIPTLALEATPTRNPAYNVTIYRKDGSQVKRATSLEPGNVLSWEEKDVHARSVIGDGMFFTIAYADVDGRVREETIRFSALPRNIERGVRGDNIGPKSTAS